MTTCWNKIPDLGNIDRYLKAIDKFPMLELAEETNCINEGDEGKMKLVLSHLRLAVKMARQYAVFGFSLDELIQEANIGLLKAVDHFDPEKGRFAGIAQAWIQSELKNFTLKNRQMVKVATTHAQRKLFFNMGRIRQERLGTRDRQTFSMQDMQEIAAEMDVKVEDVMEMDVRMRGHDISLDPLAEDNEEEAGRAIGNYIADHAADPLTVMMKAERNWVETAGAEEALDMLDDRTKFIIRNRYMEENTLTLHELAAIFGISAERVRQLEVKGFKKMREHLAEYA